MKYIANVSTASNIGLIIFEKVQKFLFKCGYDLSYVGEIWDAPFALSKLSISSEQTYELNRFISVS